MRVTLALLILLLCGGTAHAQWVLNPDDAVLNGQNSCANGASVVRTFDVASNSTVADLDLGLDVDHSWRGDVRATLTSPGPNGVSRVVVAPDVTGTGQFDNYRIRLDDEATVLINQGSHAANTPTTAPSYRDRVRPSNPLDAFDGVAAGGTWTLELCDDYPAQDNGSLLQATLFITPTFPETPPSLTCAASAPIAFDWDAPGATDGWTAGSLINGYAADGIPFNIAVTGDTANLIARAGVATPVSSNDLTAGGGAARSIVVNADFANRSQNVVLTLNLGTAGQGVGGARFILQDVDRGAWTDRVALTGSLSGAPVPISVTPGLGNRVDGQTATGTASTASGDANGQVVVTALQPVDRITLTYDNAPNAPANPVSQVIGFFGDLQLCPSAGAALLAVKSVEVDDPNGLGLFMTPGNAVVYKITVNHGPQSASDASDVDISDTLPPTLQYVSSQQTGFTAGTFANQNCPSLPCTVVFEDGVLPQGATGEIRVTALIR